MAASLWNPAGRFEGRTPSLHNQSHRIAPDLLNSLTRLPTATAICWLRSSDQFGGGCGWGAAAESPLKSRCSGRHVFWACFCGIKGMQQQEQQTAAAQPRQQRQQQCSSTINAGFPTAKPAAAAAAATAGPLHSNGSAAAAAAPAPRSKPRTATSPPRSRRWWSSTSARRS